MLKKYFKSTNKIVINTKAIIFIVTFILILVFFNGNYNSLAATGVPKLINFQGKLNGSNSLPVANGSYNIRVRIYEDADSACTNGTLKWTEERKQTNRVSVSSGLFNVLLGSLTTLDQTFNDDDFWVQVSVGGTTDTATPTYEDLAPCQRIGSVGYAYNSDTVDGKHSTDLAVLAGASGGQILTGGTGTIDDLILRTTSGVGTTGADMIFQTGNNGGTEAMRILYNGNIGVGTATPNQTLSVKGTLGIIETGASPTYYTIIQGGDQTGSDITYTLPVAAPAVTGYVLSATTAGVMSWIAQSAGSGDITAVGSMTTGDAFSDATATGDWLGLGASAGRIAFDDQATDYVNILSANLGVGTTIPRAPIDVLSTAGSQLYLTYTDNSVYTKLNTDSSGNLTIDATGTKTIIADDLQVTGLDLLDSGGNEEIRFVATGSAVNEITVTNAATTASPSIAASGETNVSLNIDGKGSGSLNLNNTATGDVLMGGGYGATGCTVYNSTGNLSCNGVIVGATTVNTINGAIINSSTQNFSANSIADSGALTVASGANGALTLNPNGTGALINTLDATTSINDAQFNRSGTLTVADSSADIYGNRTVVTNSIGALNDTANFVQFTSNITGTGTDTGSVLGLTQSNATASGDVFTISNSGTGKDISGTSGTWGITKAGAATFVGVNSGTGVLQGTGGSSITSSATTTTANNFLADSVSSGIGIALSVDALTTGVGIDISSTSTAGTASNSSKLLNLSRSGINSNSNHTAYGLYSSVIDSGTGSINIGAYLNTSGGASNYALITGAGKVGIGTSTPGQALSVAGTLGILETGASPQYYTILQGGDQTGSDITYTLPIAAPAVTGYVLSATTAGVMSWVADSGGAGTITAVGSMTTGAAFADATADDDWLGLGASAGRIEFDDQTIDEVNILGANVGINTSTPGSKLDILFNLTGIVGDANKVLNVATTGATFNTTAGNLSNYGAYFTNTSTESAGANTLTNIALYLAASGADANYALITNGGNVGIGTTTPTALLSVAEKFLVDSNGNITKINNVAYSWPASQGAANTILTNNGSGTLTWSAPPASGKGQFSGLTTKNYQTDSYTKLLIQANGTDAGTTLYDSSLTNKTVTAYGSTQIDTGQSEFGSSSIQFDGTDDYMIIPNSSDFVLTPGEAWTLDFWIRPVSLTASNQFIFEASTGGAGSRYELVIDHTGDFGLGADKLIFGYGASSLIMSCASNKLTAGSWNHVAIVKKSDNTWNLYINGNSEASVNSSLSITPTADFGIGAYDHGAGSYDFNGWIDEFRISKGIARWTSNFTAPSAKYDSSGDQIAVTANSVVVADSTNDLVELLDVNLTSIDIMTSGANGLDTGSEATSSWYYIWVIYNGTTTSGLLSTSSTAPTMPSGYTYKALVGTVYNDSPNKNFLRYYQIGDQVQYLYSVKVIDNGGTTTTTAIPLSSVVPPSVITKGVFGKVMAISAATSWFANQSSFSSSIAYDNVEASVNVYFGGTSVIYNWILPLLSENQTMYHQVKTSPVSVWVSGFTTRLGQ